MPYEHMQWYIYSLMEDEYESFMRDIEVVEYQQSFSFPDVIKSIRESRNKKPVRVDRTIFDLGDKASRSDVIIGDISDVRGMLDRIESIPSKTNIEKYTPTAKNYKYWSEINLE